MNQSTWEQSERVAYGFNLAIFYLESKLDTLPPTRQLHLKEVIADLRDVKEKMFTKGVKHENKQSKKTF